MFERIRELVAEKVGVEPEDISMETSFTDDLEADSITLFELVMAIEDEFDIEVDDESIEKIEKYIKNLSYEKFISDEKTKDAIVRNLELIGEASNQIPKEIQHRHNEIEWSQIIGLRHRLIHDYFIIDYNLVWYIVKNELSELKFNNGIL